jgi:serine/threonine-protein kinase
VLEGIVPPPSKLAPDVPNELDWIVRRGLEREPADRFGSALEMAEALETLAHPATARQVGRWVEEIAGDVIERRRQQIARMNGAPSGGPTPAGAVTPGGVVLNGTTLLDVGSVTSTSTSTLEANALDAPPRAGSPSTDARSAPRARLPRSVLAGGLGVGLAALAFVVTSSRMRARTVTEAPVEAPSTWPAVDPPPSSASSLPTPVETPPLPAAPVAADPSAEASAAAASASRAAVSHGGRTRTAKPAPTSKPSCTPPYYEDPSGIRRVKPECL